MKESELRTRSKTLALRIISVCDEIDARMKSQKSFYRIVASFAECL